MNRTKNIKRAKSKETISAQKEIKEAEAFEVQEIADSVDAPTPVTKVLQEASQKTAEQQNKKKKTRNVIFLFINIAIIAIIFVINASQISNVETIYKVVKNIDYLFYGAIACLATLILSETIKLTILIHNSSKRFAPRLAFKTYLLGRYYDLITPTTSGGMPFQVYYLYSRGLKGGASTSIPMNSYVANKMAFTFFGAFMVFSNIAILSLENSQILYFFKLEAFIDLVPLSALIVLVLNVLMLIIIMITSLNKVITKKMVATGIKIGYKMKFVKNFNTTLKKTLYNIYDYQDSSKKLFRNPWLVFGLLALSVVTVVCNAGIVFFIYSGFSGTLNWQLFGFFITAYVLIECLMAVVPLPGGSGAAEIGFILMLGQVFKAATGLDIAASWAMVVWRLFTYFGMIALGFIVMIYDKLYGNRKNLKKMRMEKEKESDATI